MSTLQYKQLHHQAKHIDRLIDSTLGASGPLNAPQEQLIALITHAYPNLYVESCGWHKIVFRSSNVDHCVVLKVGPKRSIENDHRAYKLVPHPIRYQLFATIFWHTKYCLLQEYGYPTTVSAEQLRRIRQVVYKFGIFDVKADNIRNIDGALKIVDANATIVPLPTVLRKIDEIKPKLPKKLELLAKKITKRLNEK